MKLTLDNATATLTSANPRAEMHGDRFEPAIDLDFEFAVPNTILDELQPGLLNALYKHPDPNDSDGTVEMEFSDRPTEVRFPDLKPLTFAWRLEEVPITIKAPNKNKPFSYLWTVDKFKVECLGYGIVKIKMQLKCRVDEKAFGVFAMMVRNDFQLTCDYDSADVKDDEGIEDIDTGVQGVVDEVYESIEEQTEEQDVDNVVELSHNQA